MVDLMIEWHGSIVLLYPVSTDANAWLDVVEASADDAQRFGKGLVVEPRYLADLVAHAIEHGLEVQGGVPS